MIGPESTFGWVEVVEMALPVLSPQQRQAALAKAAEARAARSQLLAAVTTGQLSIATVLDRSNDTTRRTKVEAVLRALPGYGRARTATLMADECGIDPQRRVGGLGQVQRTKLLDALTTSAATPPPT
jgi:hypothetical protein